MAQRIAVVVLLALSSYLFSPPQSVLADISSGLPHTISLTLEPESVSVESVVKITLTFIPCVDVESLSIWFKLLPEPDAQVVGALEQGWRGTGKKGEPISLSGLAIFHRPASYGASVYYEHADPQGYLKTVRGAKGFLIRVPGGIRTGRLQDRFPFRLKGTRIVEFPAERLFVDTVGVLQGSDTSTSGIHAMPPQVVEFGVSEGLRPVPKTSDSAVRGELPCVKDSLPGIWFRRTLKDSAATRSLSTTPPDTLHVIATCDKIIWYHIGGNILDMDNWRVEPWWLGTVEELPDHRARFTAGSFAGVGDILCEYEGDTYVWPVMVIANYELNCSFLYMVALSIRTENSLRTSL